MPTRLCTRCDREKSIRGVWYLTTPSRGSAFVCEACYGAAPAAVVAVDVDPEASLLS